MDDWLRELVLNRSQGVCEYCRIPQRFFSELFHIEHIVARQHRGATHESNLAISCARCNRHKGPNLSGLDPKSGSLTRLFNPRTDIWDEHFQQDSRCEIQGLTAIGRTSAYVLDMNAPRRVELRVAIMDINTAPDT